MSYSTTGYALQLDALEKLIGSGDEAALKPARKKFKRWFAPSRSETLSIGDAAIELVKAGVPARTKQPSEFYYALEVLCAAVGRTIDDDSLDSAPPDEVPLLDKLLNRGPPVKLPRCRGFPAVGFARRTEMKRLLKEFDDDEDLGPDATNAQEKIRRWLEECAASNEDLVLFHY